MYSLFVDTGSRVDIRRKLPKDRVKEWPAKFKRDQMYLGPGRVIAINALDDVAVEVHLSLEVSLSIHWPKVLAAVGAAVAVFGTLGRASLAGADSWIFWRWLECLGEGNVGVLEAAGDDDGKLEELKETVVLGKVTNQLALAVGAERLLRDI